MCVILGAANAYLGPARRHDHRRHLPGRRHRHGRAAPVQGHASSRRTSPGPSARSASRWRPAPSSRSRRSSSSRSGSSTARTWCEEYLLSAALMILGGLLGHHVRHDPAPRHGRGPRPAVPRVGGGLRDPQGRPEGRRGRRCSCSGPWASAPSSSCSTASASSGPRTTSASTVGKLKDELRPPRPRRRRARRSRPAASRTFSAPDVTPGLPRRRLHHRPRARRAELRRRPAGVGPVRPAARLLPRAVAHRPVHWRRTAATRRGLGGHGRPPLDSSSSGRSPSAACSSAPATRSTGCART